MSFTRGLSNKVKNVRKTKGTFLLFLLIVSQLAIVPSLYTMNLMYPTMRGKCVAAFNIYMLLSGNGTDGGGVTVYHVRKGFYWRLDYITVEYIPKNVSYGERVRLNVLLKEVNDTNLTWLVNNLIIEFYDINDIFGSFNNTLSELLEQEEMWKSRKTTYDIKGDFGTDIDFFAFINKTSDSISVNKTKLYNTYLYLYIYYSLWWKKDFYSAFESVAYLIVLSVIVDIIIAIVLKIIKRSKWEYRYRDSFLVRYYREIN